MLHPVDEVRAETGGLAVELDGRPAVEELFEQHADLHPGEVRAEAEVRAAPAERHVLVRGPLDVEAHRVVEDALVAVGRYVPDDDLVAGGDGLAAEREVLGGGSTEMHDRGREPQHLLGCTREQLTVGAEPRELVGVL